MSVRRSAGFGAGAESFNRSTDVVMHVEPVKVAAYRVRHVLETGMACRYRVMRQITKFVDEGVMHHSL